MTKKIFYVDMFLSHSVKLFESFLNIVENSNDYVIKFIGPEEKFPYENSSIINHVEKIWSRKNYVRKLCHYCKIQKPDLIHITFEPRTFGSIHSAIKLPLLLTMIRLLKIKIIFTLRNIVVFRKGSRWILPDYVPFKIPSFILKIFLQIFIKSICNLSDSIIVETGESKLGLSEYYGINKEKVNVVLYIGTTSEKRPLNLEKKQKLEKQCAGKKIILCFGVISPRKGQDTAIKALKLISDKLPNYILVIVGTASEGFEEYESTLRKMVKEFHLENRVIFTGYLDYDEVDVIFGISDMSLYLYRQMSASPGAIAFSLQHNVPCIVTKIPPFIEILGDDGAIFVEPDNENQLAIAIMQLASDNDLRMNLLNHMQSISKLYTWHNTSLQHFKLYEKILNNKNV